MGGTNLPRRTPPNMKRLFSLFLLVIACISARAGAATVHSLVALIEQSRVVDPEVLFGA